MAEAYGEGRVVSVLEGGYDLARHEPAAPGGGGEGGARRRAAAARPDGGGFGGGDGGGAAPPPGALATCVAAHVAALMGLDYSGRGG